VPGCADDGSGVVGEGRGETGFVAGGVGGGFGGEVVGGVVGGR
jgi:hypothetical protein